MTFTHILLILIIVILLAGFGSVIGAGQVALAILAMILVGYVVGSFLFWASSKSKQLLLPVYHFLVAGFVFVFTPIVWALSTLISQPIERFCVAVKQFLQGRWLPTIMGRSVFFMSVHMISGG